MPRVSYKKPKLNLLRRIAEGCSLENIDLRSLRPYKRLGYLTEAGKVTAAGRKAIAEMK